MPTRRKKEWFDDDSLWRDMYPILFSAKRIADATDEIDKILALIVPKGKCVLDLCCGPGRCSIALAKRGFKVTGVDRTKYLLDKAKASAKFTKVKIEWIQADMRDFVRSESYDLLLSMYTSFGYFDNKNQDVAVLRNMLTSLRPGGTCVIEVGGKEWLAKGFQPTTSNLLPDGTLLVQRHEIFDAWTRIRSECILISKGRVKTFRFFHTIYSGLELRERLEQAGFADVKLFGGLDGRPYDSNAQRLIAVGRKP
jgi:SAM-dependent methyltransferase